MDCSKLGWRAPGEACLDEIARRWPDKVLVVVDACQMRLGRRRMRNCLDRGYLVLITGSKYFGGPASGALWFRRGFRDRSTAGPEGFARTSRLCRSKRLAAPVGQLAIAVREPAELRPVAALGSRARGDQGLLPGAGWVSCAGAEGIGSGNPKPDHAVAVASPARVRTKADDADDEEFAAATIFPFMMKRHGSPLSVEACRAVHRALTHEISEMAVGGEADRQIAARRCLVGQPVRIQRRGRGPTAVLRLCVGARLVTETWSAEAGVAPKNLQREFDRVAEVVAKIGLLLAHAAARTLRSCHMDSRPLEISEAARAGCANRVGMARLAKMAFDGGSRPLWAELIAKVLDGTAGAGEGLDLSLIAQLLGDKEAGLAIQAEVLLSHQLFRSPCASRSRSCAFWRWRRRSTWAATRRSSSCWRTPAIELMTLYVIAGVELPAPLPDHDVAIVIASDSEDCRDALAQDRRRGGALAAAAAQSAAARRQSRSRQAASPARRHRRARNSGDDLP